MRYAENEPRTHFSIIFLSRKPNISKIRGDEFFNRDSEARGSTIHRFQVPLLKIFEFHNVLQLISILTVKNRSPKKLQGSKKNHQIFPGSPNDSKNPKGSGCATREAGESNYSPNF